MFELVLGEDSRNRRIVCRSVIIRSLQQKRKNLK